MELGQPDLSIIIPAIRQNYWKRLIDSVGLRKYSYEVILASPFDWPTHIEKPSNVHMLKTYDTPSVATQKGLLKANGKLVYFSVDDCIFLSNAIDSSMDFYYNNCEEHDVVNMRYTEGAGFSGKTLPIEFWTAYYHADLRLPGIQSWWKISLQPMMDREYLLDIGGLDCRWQYSNHSFHDLAARIQRDGGKYYDSPTDCTAADHMPAKTGDHGPIHDTQTLHDHPLFVELYKEENHRIKIPLDNYKQFEGVWKKRFNHQYETYQELAREEGYNV